jgi:hypothetical protein
MKDSESPTSLWLSSTPRTRCDPGEGPLWCLVMGGPSAKLYHQALLNALRSQAKQ